MCGGAEDTAERHEPKTDGGHDGETADCRKTGETDTGDNTEMGTPEGHSAPWTNNT